MDSHKRKGEAILEASSAPRLSRRGREECTAGLVACPVRGDAEFIRDVRPLPDNSDVEGLMWALAEWWALAIASLAEGDRWASYSEGSDADLEDALKAFRSAVSCAD